MKSETFTKKEKDRILQLCNDLAEDMPMGKYSRKDLINAIIFWQDASCMTAESRAALESTVTIRLAELLLMIKNKEF